MFHFVYLSYGEWDEVSTLRTNVRSTGSAYHWQTWWAYKRKALYEIISFSILSLWSSKSQNVFVPSLHIQKGLENLKAHVRSNGLRPRVHGNEKGIPHNGTPYVSLQHVVSFIENYAGREGLSLPGRVPGYKTIHRVKLLHTTTTKEDLWRCYKHAAEIGGYTVVG